MGAILIPFLWFLSPVLIPVLFVLREFLTKLKKLKSDTTLSSTYTEDDIKLNNKTLVAFVLFMVGFATLFTSLTIVTGTMYSAALAGPAIHSDSIYHPSLFIPLMFMYTSIAAIICSLYLGNKSLIEFKENPLLIGRSLCNFMFVIGGIILLVILIILSFSLFNGN